MSTHRPPSPLRVALERIVHGVDDGVMPTTLSAQECVEIAKAALAAPWLPPEVIDYLPRDRWMEVYAHFDEGYARGINGARHVCALINEALRLLDRAEPLEPRDPDPALERRVPEVTKQGPPNPVIVRLCIEMITPGTDLHRMIHEYVDRQQPFSTTPGKIQAPPPGWADLGDGRCYYTIPECAVSYADAWTVESDRGSSASTAYRKRR